MMQLCSTRDTSPASALEVVWEEAGEWEVVGEEGEVEGAGTAASSVGSRGTSQGHSNAR